MLSLTRDIPIKKMSKNEVEYAFYPYLETENNKK